MGQTDGFSFEWIADDVLELRVVGHITQPGLAIGLEIPSGEIEHKAPLCVVSSTALRSFELGVRRPGVAMLQMLRNVGVERGYLIIENPAARMLASAMGFAAGFPSEYVASVDEALSRIAARRSAAA